MAIGLSIIIEYRISSSDDSIQQVLSDRTPALAYELQNIVWTLHQEISAYSPTFATPEQFSALSDRVSAVKTHLNKMNAYFDANPHEALDHQNILQALKSLPMRLNKCRTRCLQIRHCR